MTHIAALFTPWDRLEARGPRVISKYTESRACIVDNNYQAFRNIHQHGLPLWCLRANGQVLTKVNHF